MARHGDWSQYEWDVEDILLYENDDSDVLDHSFQTSASDCLKFMKESTPTGTHWEMVLVLDNQDQRQWAYVDMKTMKLPEYFIDAMGTQTRKVPQKFHAELAKSVL